MFYAFLKDKSVKRYGVEAGGRGLHTGEHAARFHDGRVGVLQGTQTYVLQDARGQVRLTHSVSAGLDYAAVGPEHSLLKDLKRVEYSSVSDSAAVKAVDALCIWEGILPALESAHAVSFVMKNAGRWKKKDIVIINLSGRGDKDVAQLTEWKRTNPRGRRKT